MNKITLLFFVVLIFQLSGCSGGKAKKSTLSVAEGKDIGTIIESAESASLSGNWAQAISFYEEAVKADPYNKEARHGLAKSLESMARSPKLSSKDRLDLLLRSNSLDIELPGLKDRLKEALLSEAERLEKAGKIQEAKGTLTLGIEALPDDISLLMLKAHLCESDLDFSEEMTIRELIFSKGGLDKENFIRLITLHERNNNSVRSKYFMDQAQLNYPDENIFDSTKKILTQEDLQKLEIMAKDAFEKGKYGQVIDDIEKMRNNRKVSQENLKMLGLSYEKLDMVDNAKLVLEEALNEQPDDKQLILAMGKIRALAGDINGAGELLSRGVSILPTDSELKFAYSGILEKQGRTNEAVALIDEVLSTDPKNAEALERKGFLFFRARAYLRAIEVWNEMLFQEQSNGTIYFNIGAANAMQRRWMPAISNYREALRLEPQNPKYYYYLFIALKETKDYKSMEAVKDRILELDKDGEYGRLISKIYDLSGSSKSDSGMLFDTSSSSPEELYNQGLSAARAGKFDSAVSFFSQFTKLEPEHIDALLNLGNVHMARGDYIKAIVEYSRAIRVQGDYAPTYQFIAHAYSQLGIFDEAKAYYQKSLSLEPDNLEIIAKLKDIERSQPLSPSEREERYLKIADALSENNFLDEAFVLISKAGTLAPSSWNVLLSAAKLYSKSRIYDKAEEYLNRALIMAPEEPLVLAANGEYYEQKGQIREAIDYYLKAITRDPSLVVQGLKLCQLYRENGEIELARKALSTLIPNSPKDHELLGRELHRYEDLTQNEEDESRE